MDKELISVGQKVHYAPSHGGGKENGIVKSITEHGVFVVYNCNGEWDRIEDYTAANTNPRDLGAGWAAHGRTQASSAKIFLMPITKVSYQAAYPTGPFLQERIGFEMDISAGDDPLESVAHLKRLADEAHKANNPQLQEAGILDQFNIPPQKPDIKFYQTDASDPNDTAENGIKNATTLEDLSRYRLLANQDKDLRNLYMQKLKELQP